MLETVRQSGSQHSGVTPYGRSLATRLANDALYRHLPDPAGLSLIMTDAHGAEAGALLYDGFGAVLTSTLPITLTSAMPDLPDAATGLALLGGGRWYDPAVGRPLQPNSAGAPPTAPQALNRYTAGALGQPGVFAAASQDHFNWLSSGASFSYGLATQLTGKAHRITGYSYTGYALMEVTASHTALTRKFRQLPASVTEHFGNPYFAFSKNGRDFYRRVGLKSLTGSSSQELIRNADEFIDTLRQGLPKHGPWTTRITSRTTTVETPLYQTWNKKPGWNRAVTRIGFGLDFTIGFGVQLADDYGNPYLTKGQVGLRTATAGMGSGVFGLIGGSAGTACGPAAIICVPIGAAAGGWIWTQHIQPVVFQASPFSPAERNLAPLQ